MVYYNYFRDVTMYEIVPTDVLDLYHFFAFAFPVVPFFFDA
jgi:hypothetical protein